MRRAPLPALRSRHPPRLSNGTRVHVRSDHFAEECDAVIRKGKSDHGQGDVGWWLYRVEVTRGQTPKDAQHDDGTVWVWDFEVTALQAPHRVSSCTPVPTGVLFGNSNCSVSTPPAPPRVTSLLCRKPQTS